MGGSGGGGSGGGGGKDTEACLASRMRRLMLDAHTADCTVEVGGVEFPSHKCILANASPVFRTMLYDAGMREQRDGRTPWPAHCAGRGAGRRGAWSPTFPVHSGLNSGGLMHWGGSGPGRHTAAAEEGEEKGGGRDGRRH